MSKAFFLINSILETLLDPSQLEWLRKKQLDINDATNPRTFYLAFGMVPRKLGSKEVIITEASNDKMDQYYPGFAKGEWAVDQLGRVSLMISLPPKLNTETLNQLFSTADLNELVSLYKGLFFFGKRRRFHNSGY